MPLQFDMPYEELLTYKGTNPRPDDFDDYWDKAVNDLDVLDPDVHMEPADFQTPFAECYHLYFTGLGGSRIHAKYLKPKQSAESHPAVILFHGYEGNSGDWVDKLGYVAAGYTVAALDCRGQGGLSEDRNNVKGSTLSGHIVRGLADTPESFLYRQIFLDTVLMARIIMGMPDVDKERVGVSGFSQGGGLALACAALVPEINRVATIGPFLCDYQRVWEIDLDVDAYGELREYFRRFDPRHECIEETFTKLGYIDVQFLAPRIKAQVLMGVGLMDTVCPPSTQFSAYNKISSAKSLAIYPDYGHEELPGHADQIYQFLMGL
jgi:cephalosporin-C deacetylase